LANVANVEEREVQLAKARLDVEVYPKVKHSIDLIVGGTDGTVLVRPTTEGGLDPLLSSFMPELQPSAYKWDLISASNEWLQSVLLPREFRPQLIESGTIFGVLINSFGVASGSVRIFL
jgi:hypothetical protein